MSVKRRKLIIGSRGSRLALWQAEEVRRLIPVESEIKIIKTSGDRFLDVPLQGSLEKGFFTKEIEDELLSGTIDFAVHSLKDLPTEQPEGLEIAAYLKRDAVCDVLIAPPIWLDENAAFPLKDGCDVGATSLRRQALLRTFAPRAKAKTLRGNVPTRIEKLRGGEYGAIILSSAGIKRLSLDLSGLAAFELNPEIWIPAPGQGVVAVETASVNEAAKRTLESLDDRPTRLAAEAERRVLKNFGGGCHSAFASYVKDCGGVFKAFVGLELDGKWLKAAVEGSLNKINEFGPTMTSEFKPLSPDGIKVWTRLS